MQISLKNSETARRSIASEFNDADCRKQDAGLIPHDQPGGPLVANLAAFWQQISPIVPVLPTVPTHKSCAVYNLAFEAFHGMEEVVGSIPTRSTNPLHNLARPSRHAHLQI